MKSIEDIQILREQLSKFIELAIELQDELINLQLTMVDPIYKPTTPEKDVVG